MSVLSDVRRWIWRYDWNNCDCGWILRVTETSISGIYDNESAWLEAHEKVCVLKKWWKGELVGTSMFICCQSLDNAKNMTLNGTISRTWDATLKRHVYTLDANPCCPGMLVSFVLNKKILTLARIGDRMLCQYHRYSDCLRYSAADDKNSISIKMKKKKSIEFISAHVPSFVMASNFFFSDLLELQILVVSFHILYSFSLQMTT